MWTTYIYTVVELIACTILFFYINHRNAHLHRTLEAVNRKVIALESRVDMLESALRHMLFLNQPQQQPPLQQLSRLPQIPLSLPRLENINEDNEDGEEDDDDNEEYKEVKEIEEESSQPDQSSQPEQPSQPSQPEQPEQPSQPEQPDQQETTKPKVTSPRIELPPSF